MHERTIQKRDETVYLLHFEKPYKHARHYLGFTTDLKSRLIQHAMGAGARLMEVVTSAGIDWRLVRTWKGTRQLERRLKNRKAAARFCPICAGRVALLRAEYPLERAGKERKKIRCEIEKRL